MRAALLQKIISTLMLAGTFSGVCALEITCDLQTSIDFITPGIWSQPWWRYFAGPNTSFDQVSNWATNLLGTGVQGGGHTANVFTDHGAGAIFWTSNGGHYNLTGNTLSPVNSAIRNRENVEWNPRLRDVVRNVIGDENLANNILPIAQIHYFPEYDRDILGRLLDRFQEDRTSQNITYGLIFHHDDAKGLQAALKTFPEWKLVGQFTIGVGNTSIEGLPEENGPGFNTYAYLVGL